MAAAFTALQQAPLVRAIAEFQDGLFVDLATFLAPLRNQTYEQEDHMVEAFLQALHAGDTLEYVQRYLVCRPGTLTSRHIDAAAQLGYMQVVKFLCALGLPLSLYALPKAAIRGHLDVVEFLHHHVDRTPDSVHIALNHAAHAGHLAVVQFLYEHRVEELTVVPIVSAANGGRADVEQYLRARFRPPPGL
ncbi:Aste57867_9646 [Aphanomyces stellatus]|uniref:Aste57867_9646 protein n=1 Tax=Aphanomyces stellatus TaxID=120398 RepID=A0A485KNE3_9STRA|nr:hypothetical protein As57867_009608 [Aphanomyces stellatus]VFT86525.1 Aste57867_9646 [Aphanomyces stellatus]